MTTLLQNITKYVIYLFIYLYHTCEFVKMFQNDKNKSPHVKYVTYSLCHKQYNSFW